MEIDYQKCWKLLKQGLQKHIEKGLDNENISYAVLNIMKNIEEKFREEKKNEDKRNN